MRTAAAIAALGLALVLSGGLFDAEPLLAAGVAVAALPMGAAPWVLLAGRGAFVSRELSASRVVEEEPLELRLKVEARVPLPGGELLEPLLDAPVQVRALRRRTGARVRVRFARRGWRHFAPATLVVADPLGIAAREVRGDRADEVLVLPRVEAVRPLGGGSQPGFSAVRTPAPGTEGVDPDGLRPYREGAPASRIHWPALARGAGLLELRLAPDADRVPLVVLDTAGGVADEYVDAAVRAAASLTLELGRAGGCALLLPGERRPVRVASDLGAWPAAWARLAVVAAGTPALGALAARAGPVLYVTGRPATAVPRAVVRAGAVVVAPADAGGAPRGRPLFEVAGCVGHAPVVAPRGRWAA